MLRTLVGIAGGLAALFPGTAVDIFESIAVESPDECTTRPWVESVIRAEGVATVLASLVGGRAYAWTMNLTGIFGAVLLLRPQAYRRVASTFLYENPVAVEWNERFTDGVRLVGAAYVLMAVRTLADRRAAE